MLRTGSNRNSAKTIAAPTVPTIPDAVPNFAAANVATPIKRNGIKRFDGLSRKIKTKAPADVIHRAVPKVC